MNKLWLTGLLTAIASGVFGLNISGNRNYLVAFHGWSTG